MCKVNTDWTIIKYFIITLIELVLSISGIFSVLTIYKLYESTLLFYFLLYNIIVSIFGIFHFLKGVKDILNDEVNDTVYVKIKVLLMITSFIWGIVILEHREIILFYQNNYPRVYVSFINYFIMSSLAILDTGYKILYYICEIKKPIKPDYSIIARIDDELGEDYKNELDEDYENRLRIEMIPKTKVKSNEINYRIYNEDIFYK
jgi:hypothetical protein